MNDGKVDESIVVSEIVHPCFYVDENNREYSGWKYEDCVAKFPADFKQFTQSDLNTALPVSTVSVSSTSEPEIDTEEELINQIHDLIKVNFITTFFATYCAVRNRPFPITVDFYR